MTDTSVKKMMYVYFDDTMNIVGISPLLDADLLAKGSRHTRFPIDEVAPFITGERNLSTHYVSPLKDDPTKYAIKAKSIEVNYIRTLDRFLTEIDQGQSSESAHLTIINNIKEKKIIFSLSPKVKYNILQDESIETKNITINGMPELDFFFTVKNDPSFLILYVPIKTNELVGEPMIVVNYSVDLSESSLFTKKIFDNYVYEVK